MILEKINNTQFENVVLYKFVNDSNNSIFKDLPKFIHELEENYRKLIDKHINETVVIMFDTRDFFYIQLHRTFVHSTLKFKVVNTPFTVNTILYKDYLTVSEVSGMFVSDYNLEATNVGVENIESKKLIDIGF